MNLAINGFGRIGRQAFKIAFGRKNIHIAAINSLGDAKTMAHLLKHDTSYHDWDKDVSFDEKNLIVEGKKIPVYAEKDPANLPWKQLKIDVVLECTGKFTKREESESHIKAGAKKVVVSAPGKGGEIPVYVRGVNCGQIKTEKSNIISNASCTTNCIAPVMAVLGEKFGIKKAMMSTAHGYTSDQNLQDNSHKDLRRARAAAANIVPTTTGAAKTVGEVIPDLKGIFDGLALRVPILTVSLSDITAVLNKKVTKEEINQALIDASKTPRFKNILTTTSEELVSSDFTGNPYSAVVDLNLTNVIDGDLVKVVAWYDNEMGYSYRLVEIAELFC